MKAKRNLWLSRIIQETGETDRESAIQILANRFRQEQDSLDAITLRLGVTEIITEPLPFDGGVYEVGGERLIKLNSLAKSVRQRFTLAHEIGHLILERIFQATVYCTSDIQLERMCDMLAAELVMPAAKARAMVSAMGEQSPEKLGVIANRFQVSLVTAAQTLYDLGLWKMSMGMWKYGPQSQEIWFVGKRPWRTINPSFSAFELAVESKGPVCTRERFSKGSYTELVDLKAHHIGKNYVVAIVATIDK